MHFAVEFVLCTFECVCECVPAAVDGLFGTFTMKPNTDYDPHDRKSIKFIRHRDVARSAVLVFNVQTFTANKKLHISLESLTCLSHVRGMQYPLPAAIPASHRGNTTGNAGTGNAGTGGGTTTRTRLRDESAKPCESNTRVEIFWTDENRWFKGGQHASSMHNLLEPSRCYARTHACTQHARSTHCFVPHTPGTVTSSRKDEEDYWISRVAYDKCSQWRAHSEWHHLDPLHPDPVIWRLQWTVDTPDAHAGDDDARQVGEDRPEAAEAGEEDADMGGDDATYAPPIDPEMANLSVAAHPAAQPNPAAVACQRKTRKRAR